MSDADVGIITADELAAALSSRDAALTSRVVIDLRPSSHFYCEHVKAAINIPARPAALAHLTKFWIVLDC